MSCVLQMSEGRSARQVSRAPLEANPAEVVQEYTDPKRALWAFDEEIARPV